MKKILVGCFCFMMCCLICAVNCADKTFSFADTGKNYYTVYKDESKTEVLFLKGDDVFNGDKYLSKDNKLYEITSVNEKEKSAIAKFIKDEVLPEYKVKSKNNLANAATKKKVGVYHTHNDESYYTPDGIDSVYGKGGIHDVGKRFVSNLNTEERNEKCVLL